MENLDIKGTLFGGSRCLALRFMVHCQTHVNKNSLINVKNLICNLTGSKSLRVKGKDHAEDGEITVMTLVEFYHRAKSSG